MTTATAGPSGWIRASIAGHALQARLMWEWRPTRLAIVRRTILQYLVACLSLVATGAIVRGLQIDGPAALLLGGALLATMNQAARLLGHWLLVKWPLLLVDGVALLGQYAVILILGRVVPGFHVDGAGTAIWTTVWLTALNGLLSELVAVSDDDSYYSLLVRRLVARRGRNAPSMGRGLLIVQLDGVARPVLETAVKAGHAPTLGRLLRTGGSALHSWSPLLPPTTPASQIGILHGRADVVPGFRWFEKETGRLIVADHPDDAAEILRRASDGRGLLSDDGVSISNLVSGDAPRSYLTMATIEAAEPTHDERRLRGFFVGTVNYPRLVVLTVGEMVKELYQAERQRSRGIEPRMHRGLLYAIERAVTNVALRTVATSLAIEEMYRGATVIYIDYTGYDAVAHHCGPQRREAIDALEGIDRSIASLLMAARHAAREYDLVALSDHGQNLGPTFSQACGQSLEDLLAGLMGGSPVVASGAGTTEHAGSGRRIAMEFGRASGLVPFLARRSFRPRAPAGAKLQAGESGAAPDAVVCSSGNLAYVYFPAFPGRMSRGAVEARYPGLIAGLACHPAIGVVLVRGDDGALVAVGPAGEAPLAADAAPAAEVSVGDLATFGSDPLDQFGPAAREALASLNQLGHLGDLILIGSVGADTEEAVSFEELVGSHGGLGGAQMRPFLLCPAAWIPRADPLVGAVAVHDQLAEWRSACADGNAQAGPRPGVA
jgi:uncharacterized membrane protein YvlD (DUF360 family)